MENEFEKNEITETTEATLSSQETETNAAAADFVEPSASDIAGNNASAFDYEAANSGEAAAFAVSEADADDAFSSDEAEIETDAEILFRKDILVSEVRQKAIHAQRGRLLNAFPKVLLYNTLKILPVTVIILIWLYYFMKAQFVGNGTAGVSILTVLLILLLPLLISGATVPGLIRGGMDISRGSGFRIGSLFRSCKSGRSFGKSMLAYIIVGVCSMICSVICLLPALIVRYFSANLSYGFANIATSVIVILLYIAGIILSASLYLRFALVFPLMNDRPKKGVFELIKLSVSGMKGQTWKLLALLLSYIGWAVLAFGIAWGLVIAFVKTPVFNAIYSYFSYGAIEAFYSGQLERLCLYQIMPVSILLLLITILSILAAAFFLPRPLIALAAFYDTLIGYEPPVEEPEAQEFDAYGEPVSPAADDAEKNIAFSETNSDVLPDAMENAVATETAEKNPETVLSDISENSDADAASDIAADAAMDTNVAAAAEAAPTEEQ